MDASAISATADTLNHPQAAYSFLPDANAQRERLDRVDEAFLHERSIDPVRRTSVRGINCAKQLALAEIQLHDAGTDQLDVEGLLAFTEHLLTNAAQFWIELALNQKQQLQKVLFPEGLRFDGRRFGTAVTCLAFGYWKKTASGNQDWRPQRVA